MLDIKFFEQNHGAVLDDWIGLRFTNSAGFSLDEWDATPFVNPYYYKNLYTIACPLFEAEFIFGFDKTWGCNIIAKIKELTKSFVVITVQDYDGLKRFDGGWASVIQERDFVYALGGMNEDYSAMIREEIVLDFPKINGSIRHGGYHVRGLRNDAWGLDHRPEERHLIWGVSGTIVSQDEKHIAIINDETKKQETYLVNWSCINHESKNDLTEESDYAPWMGLNIYPIFFPNR